MTGRQDLPEYWYDAIYRANPILDRMRESVMVQARIIAGIDVIGMGPLSADTVLRIETVGGAPAKPTIVKRPTLTETDRAVHRAIRHRLRHTGTALVTRSGLVKMTERHE